MTRELISFGPITIYWYSITMLLGILTGYYIAMKEAKHQGLKTYFDDLIFNLIVLGIIGARLYYVIFEFANYKNNLLNIVKIWEGGIAIYGAIIAGFVVTINRARKHQKSIIQTTDILVPGLIVGQAIGVDMLVEGIVSGSETME